MEKSLFIITASAAYLNQGLSELQELDGTLRASKLLGNGIAIVETRLPSQEFIKLITTKKPIFIRHMNAVDYVLDIGEDGPVEIAGMVGSYGSILQGQRIAVQVRKGAGDYPYSPMDVKSAIDAVLSEKLSAVPEVKEPERIISVLLCNEKCYIGMGNPQENISAWSGGMLHYKKSDDDISRAKYKLMEAIEVFHIDMKSFSSALDLGAAPGGWTSVLLEHGLSVTAVDTGDMDDRLYKYKGFRFIKANASELELTGATFDLLTSDISWNPKNTAKLINNASKYLKSGRTAVVTLKLMGEKVRKTIKEVLSLYKENFELLGVKQLFHNRDEVTLYLRKR